MKKFIALSFLLSTFLLSISQVENNFKSEYNPSPIKQDWELVWHDEFDADMLDLSKWVKKDASTSNGRHWEWWNKENVIIDQDTYGDVLVLQAKEELCQTGNCTYECDLGHIHPRIYSSGEISTDLPNGSFKYGYFEARIKVPYGVGFFPSFWLSIKHGLTNKAYPPELDILEYAGDGNYEYTGTNQLPGCKDDNHPICDAVTMDMKKLEPWNDFFVYGMEWNEFEIKWFINGVKIGTTKTEDVPHDFLRIVLSLQLYHIPEPPIGLGDLSGENKKMYVDWVRVWRPVDAPQEYDYSKWNREWKNEDTGMLGEWNLSNDDRFVTGDFNNDGSDEVLSISIDNKYAKLHTYYEEEEHWLRRWGNGGEYNLNSPWNIRSLDTYISGNFDKRNGDKDELLCISHDDNRFAKILTLNEQWVTVWGNAGGYTIGDWNIGTYDKYFACDFNNDGQDDIICFSESPFLCGVYTYNYIGWTELYSNRDTPGKIIPTNSNFWNISDVDTYSVGDFNGNGKGDLLMVNEYNGSAKMYEFQNNNWVYLFGNGGNGSIGEWNLNPGSRYFTADFDNDHLTELFCISPDNKFEKILNFSGVWTTGWGNAGSYQIYNRDFMKSDKYYFGNFIKSSESIELFWVKNSWERCGTTHVYLHSMPSFNLLKDGIVNRNEYPNSNSNSEIKIYPNPNNGLFTFVPIHGAIYDISVFNSLGQRVIDLHDLENNQLVDLSTQPSGVFVLYYNDRINNVYKKIVVR